MTSEQLNEGFECAKMLKQAGEFKEVLLHQIQRLFIHHEIKNSEGESVFPDGDFKNKITQVIDEAFSKFTFAVEEKFEKI